MFPRRFALIRHVDYTGVSGVGVVAYGVVFSDGQVALRWCSDHPATSLWDSIDDLLAVHGHGDSTGVQWIDDSEERLEKAAESLANRRARRARTVTPPKAGDVRPPPPTTGPLPRWTDAEDAPVHKPSRPDPQGALPADDPSVPPPRRPAGRHRRQTEPSGESASSR